MPSLKEIRNRLRSVENIKQITTAMEMVASARLRKAQAKAKQSQPYTAKMKEILENLAAASKDFNHPLFEQRPVNKTGLLVVTADRGLCGTYNSSILQASDRFLKEHSPETVELTLIGRKAIEYYKHRKKWTIRNERTEWSGKITFDQIKDLAAHIVQEFLDYKIDAVWIVYTQFHRVFYREIIVEQFLPIGKPKAQTQTTNIDYILEPNLEEIYAEILPRYCINKIQMVLYNAYASELAARIISMKTAAQNAEEMIKNLTLVRNKVRQASITKEMLEITSGAESLIT